MNRFYLREFQLYDGENTIIFNIVALYEGRDKITVAVTKNGKIEVIPVHGKDMKIGLLTKILKRTGLNQKE